MSIPFSGPITPLPLVSPNPYRGMDNSANSHTTNPSATASQSPVPLTSTGAPITSLRNRYHFPTAANLPHDDDIDRDYFALNPSSRSFRPKKHWAYLGEITDMHKLARLYLSTRDQAGIEIPIWFHLDHFGNERPAGSPFRVFTPDSTVAASGIAVEDGVTLKVGHTFVVVYPELRQFRDGTCGIRIDGDEKAGFKVLPYSLDEILSANDTIVAQKLPNFTPVCQQCNAEIGSKKLRCSKCHVAHYCNKECQVADWNPSTSANAQGHKALCKLYKEVQWFTEMDWDNYVFRQGIRFQR